LIKVLGANRKGMEIGEGEKIGAVHNPAAQEDLEKRVEEKGRQG
jgi:hypothetical protein